jgi:hypothetical protein
MNDPLRIRHRNQALLYVVVGIGFVICLVGLCLCVLERNPADVIGFIMLLTWFMVSGVYLLWKTIFLWRHLIEANAEAIIWRGAFRCRRVAWAGVEVASWRDGVLTIRGSNDQIQIKGRYYNEHEVVLLLDTISGALPPAVIFEMS